MSDRRFRPKALQEAGRGRVGAVQGNPNTRQVSFTTTFVLKAVVSLTVPDCWVTSIAPLYDAEVRVIDRKPLKGGGMQDLFEIRAMPDRIEGILGAIQKFSRVSKLDVVYTSEGGLVGITYSDNCAACKALSASRCFISEAVCRGTADFEWTLFFREKAALKHLMENLERLGYSPRLSQLAPVRRNRLLLTARQEEILMNALELGYFEYPKKVGIEDLAKRFKVSKSTVSEILRRGEEKVLSTYTRRR